MKGWPPELARMKGRTKMVSLEGRRKKKRDLDSSMASPATPTVKAIGTLITVRSIAVGATATVLILAALAGTAGASMTSEIQDQSGPSGTLSAQRHGLHGGEGSTRKRLQASLEEERRDDAGRKEPTWGAVGALKELRQHRGSLRGAGKRSLREGEMKMRGGDRVRRRLRKAGSSQKRQMGSRGRSLGIASDGHRHSLGLLGRGRHKSGRLLQSFKRSRRMEEEALPALAPSPSNTSPPLFPPTLLPLLPPAPPVATLPSQGQLLPAQETAPPPVDPSPPPSESSTAPAPALEGNLGGNTKTTGGGLDAESQAPIEGRSPALALPIGSAAPEESKAPSPVLLAFPPSPGKDTAALPVPNSPAEGKAVAPVPQINGADSTTLPPQGDSNSGEGTTGPSPQAAGAPPAPPPPASSQVTSPPPPASSQVTAPPPSGPRDAIPQPPVSQDTNSTDPGLNGNNTGTIDTPPALPPSLGMDGETGTPPVEATVDPPPPPPPVAESASPPADAEGAGGVPRASSAGAQPPEVSPALGGDGASPPLPGEDGSSGAPPPLPGEVDVVPAESTGGDVVPPPSAGEAEGGAAPEVRGASPGAGAGAEAPDLGSQSPESTAGAPPPDILHHSFVPSPQEDPSGTEPPANDNGQWKGVPVPQGAESDAVPTYSDGNGGNAPAPSPPPFEAREPRSQALPQAQAPGTLEGDSAPSQSQGPPPTDSLGHAGTPVGSPWEGHVASRGPATSSTTPEADTVTPGPQVEDIVKAPEAGGVKSLSHAPSPSLSYLQRQTPRHYNHSSSTPGQAPRAAPSGKNSTLSPNSPVAAPPRSRFAGALGPQSAAAPYRTALPPAPPVILPPPPPDVRSK